MWREKYELVRWYEDWFKKKRKKSQLRGLGWLWVGEFIYIDMFFIEIDVVVWQELIAKKFWGNEQKDPQKKFCNMSINNIIFVLGIVEGHQYAIV